MRYFAAVISALVFFFTGCSTVEIPEPLPSEANPADLEKFEGLWQVEENAISIRFTEDGVLHFASLNWKGDQFEMQEGEALVTKGENHNYLSLRMNEQAEKEGNYTFVQYEFNEAGDLVVRGPNVKAIGEAVEAGEFPGSIKSRDQGKTVLLSGEPQEVLEFLDGPKNRELFNREDAAVLKKLAGAGD